MIALGAGDRFLDVFHCLGMGIPFLIWVGMAERRRGKGRSVAGAIFLVLRGIPSNAFQENLGFIPRLSCFALVLGFLCVLAMLFELSCVGMNTSQFGVGDIVSPGGSPLDR